MQVRFPGREEPLQEETATYSSIFPGKSYGQRSLAGYSPKGCKEKDMTECTLDFHMICLHLGLPAGLHTL